VGSARGVQTAPYNVAQAAPGYVAAAAASPALACRTPAVEARSLRSVFVSHAVATSLRNGRRCRSLPPQ